MESQCFGLPYSPYSNAYSVPTMIGLDSRSSSHCHFYNPCDIGSLCDNLSQPTPFPNNSSPDYTTHFHQSGDTTLPFNSSADANHHIRHALQELETALMAADDDDQLITSHPHFPRSQHHPQLHGATVDSTPTSNLKQLLILCAQALSENRLYEFNKLVELARGAVSINGEPLQRIGSYMLEGLVARKESACNNIYRTLNCNQPHSRDLLSYMHALYEVCPYWKFTYMAANGAIAEACKNEDQIHIIDFQIALGIQWTTLLQALAERPTGAPRVRITGIDDPLSRFARGAGLEVIGERYSEISKKFNIPVEFHGVPVLARDVTIDMLDVRPGEALAVNFPLLLHQTPDESVDVSNPRDGLLRMVKSLSPKVVTLVEQEANTNTAAFLPRFVETLDYYSALLESMHVGRRIDVEQELLGRDIVNVIACEGKERVERHEVFGKWRSRFMMAGFKQRGLSPYVNSVIRGLLKGYSQQYSLVEKDGAILFGWKNRNLISASAWH